MICGLSETFQAHRTIAFQDYANVHTGRICLHDALGSSKERNVFELIRDQIFTVFEKQMNTSVKQLSKTYASCDADAFEKRFQRNYGNFQQLNVERRGRNGKQWTKRKVLELALEHFECIIGNQCSINSISKFSLRFIDEVGLNSTLQSLSLPKITGTLDAMS